VEESVLSVTAYMYVHGVNNIRQIEIHIADPLVPECNAFVD